MYMLMLYYGPLNIQPSNFKARWRGDGILKEFTILSADLRDIFLKLFILFKVQVLVGFQRFDLMFN